MVKMVNRHLEPASRKAVREAALSAHQDEVQLGLALLEAIPPSPTSHVEGGAAGLALLGYLASTEDPPQAVKIAAAAAPKTMFPTSRRDLALLALRSAAASTPGALARLGVEMVGACYPPYPFDGAVAGEVMLSSLVGMPLDETSREFLAGSRRELETLQDHELRAEHATRSLERLAVLQDHCAEVTEMAAGHREKGGGIQESPGAVRVGGVLLPRRRS